MTETIIYIYIYKLKQITHDQSFPPHKKALCHRGQQPRGMKLQYYQLWKDKVRKQWKVKIILTKTLEVTLGKVTESIILIPSVPKESLSKSRKAQPGEGDRSTNTACWKEVTHSQKSSPEPSKLNDNRPSHKSHKKKKKNYPNQTRQPTVPSEMPDQPAPTPKRKLSDSAHKARQ